MLGNTKSKRAAAPSVPLHLAVASSLYAFHWSSPCASRSLPPLPAYATTSHAPRYRKRFFFLFYFSYHILFIFYRLKCFYNNNNNIGTHGGRKASESIDTTQSRPDVQAMLRYNHISLSSDLMRAHCKLKGCTARPKLFLALADTWRRSPKHSGSAMKTAALLRAACSSLLA